ncbi:glycerophosphodiester phosphodiesterase [Streptomyces cavernicola]|uniref:Glycerophosphodiester phosphodiesterase family protein n=1 Tax=Streptomyces cavernicola TaxID=3043613 RepID=A0ABT6SCN7_9ACTN|nr:glycerophosphodiester phosphodiesterase family protein [Streptomyces sp. B-S-A6]MDI3405965.1 glycerophosphodiester phosphodiesterase family protein [Streptomyces sp. B-S-A6]
MVTMAAPAVITALALAGNLTGVTSTGPAAPLEWSGGGPLTVDALPRITYTAHRGGALEVPENSMSGLMAAFERGTAQVLDVDTRVLRDGTLVAMHDATLDRTTDRKGPVRALTAKQWRDVRLVPRPSLGKAWRPERPPTVAEVLDRFGGRTVLLLEVKDKDGLVPLSRMLHKRGLTRSVLVNSNWPAVAERAHELGLRAQLWRSAEQMRHDKPHEWRAFVDVLDVDYKARDQDLVRAVDSGIPHVWAHTVNSTRQRDRVLRLGCDGVITNAPGLLTRTPMKGPARARPLSEE